MARGYLTCADFRDRLDPCVVDETGFYLVTLRQPSGERRTSRMVTIPLIFVIAGVLLVVVAVVGGGLEVKELKVPPLPPFGRVLSAIVGVAFTVVGLTLNGFSIPVPGAPRSGGEVTIDSPREGADVPSSLVVLGRVTLPAEDTGYYWLVLQDEGADAYPQQRITVQQDGRWEESVMFGPAWSGKIAKILVGHASGAVDSKLEQSKTAADGTLPKGLRNVVTRNVRVRSP